MKFILKISFIALIIGISLTTTRSANAIVFNEPTDSESDTDNESSTEPIVKKPNTHTYNISGTVTFTDGSPAVGYTVKVFIKKLRGNTEMGAGITDASGFYSTGFEADPKIIILAIAFKGGVPVTSSPPVINPNENEIINLVIAINKEKTKNKIKQLFKTIL